MSREEYLEFHESKAELADGETPEPVYVECPVCLRSPDYLHCDACGGSGDKVVRS